MSRCKSIIDSVSNIFESPTFAKCLGVENQQILRHDLESTRLSLPIETVFDTGFNLTVLGDAGAGKTTSLQMYARAKLLSNLTINYAFLLLSHA